MWHKMSRKLKSLRRKENWKHYIRITWHRQVERSRRGGLVRSKIEIQLAPRRTPTWRVLDSSPANNRRFSTRVFQQIAIFISRLGEFARKEAANALKLVSSWVERRESSNASRIQSNGRAERSRGEGFVVEKQKKNEQKDTFHFFLSRWLIILHRRGWTITLLSIIGNFHRRFVSDLFHQFSILPVLEPCLLPLWPDERAAR